MLAPWTPKMCSTPMAARCSTMWSTTRCCLVIYSPTLRTVCDTTGEWHSVHRVGKITDLRPFHLPRYTQQFTDIPTDLGMAGQRLREKILRARVICAQALSFVSTRLAELCRMIMFA